MGAIGLVLSAVAIDTQMTNAVNAHYFAVDFAHEVVHG
jgi:hypothetical protein